MPVDLRCYCCKCIYSQNRVDYVQWIAIAASSTTHTCLDTYAFIKNFVVPRTMLYSLPQANSLER